MSKTTLVWLCMYFSGISASLISGPIYGLLTYMFTFYTQFSWADDLMRERWSLYASLAMLVTYMLHKGKQKKLSFFEIPPMKWLVLFLINMLLVSPFAFNGKENMDTVISFLKLVILYILIVCIVRTKMHYKMFLWLQLWGNYLFGWQGYHEGTTGGRLEGIGGPATKASNSLANHLIMILPFINNFFFFGNKWEKIAVIYVTPWILNAIILCNSRAAFLGIIAMAVMAIIRSEKKIRKKMLIGLILGGLLFVYLADDRFWKRMDTIDDKGQRGSWRIETWLGAIDLIKDHPFGVGGGGFVYLSPIYIPEVVAAYKGEKRSVHNSYLKVATNYGIQGLIIYMLFISCTLLELRKMRKRAGSYDDTFYILESSAIEIAIWGFLITAIFGARPYFEVLFWYCALGTALSNMQLSEIKDRSIEKREIVDNMNGNRNRTLSR